MDYRELHANVRRQGDIALERRIIHDPQERDEPSCDFIAAQAAEAARREAAYVNICGRRFSWRELGEGADLPCAPTAEERTLLESRGFEIGQENGSYFVFDPVFFSGDY